MEIIDEYETDFYLTNNLTYKQISVLDKILNAGDRSLRKFNRRIQESAEQSGRYSKDIVLRDKQVLPMLMSLVTKRFFIGDEPGLGKTVMSASCYANYRYHMIKKNRTPTKVLVVTTSSHVVGFAKEWKSYGINLLSLTGGSSQIEKTFKEEDYREYDGLVINWDGLKTNAFLDHYLRNHEEYDYAVFDETGTLKKDKSMLYRVTNNLVNKYGNGIERVIFLNGSSFESNIFDFYYQFKVLEPKLIPNKQFLEDNYVIRGGASVYAVTRSGLEGRQRGMAKKYMGAIKDYKNQEELRERLKYFYIARSKQDYSKELPSKNYVSHLVKMTSKQKRMLNRENNTTILNSPTTRDESVKMTKANSPKLAELLDFVEKVEKDRPIIYVYNIESQKVIKRELDKLGYKTDIINGNVSSEGKSDIEDKFNNGELDMLVFNIQRAMNLPTSDRILFYDIPIMPHQTRQIIGRIDRNNYDTPKFYDFFCYLESPEMENMVRLSLFRENQGSAFTGQESYIYQTIIDQLSLHYGQDMMEKVKDKSEKEEDFFDSDEWIEIANEFI